MAVTLSRDCKRASDVSNKIPSSTCMVDNRFSNIEKHKLSQGKSTSPTFTCHRSGAGIQCFNDHRSCRKVEDVEAQIKTCKRSRCNPLLPPGFLARLCCYLRFRLLSTYKYLFMAVFLGNCIILVVWLATATLTPGRTSNAASLNLLIATLIRQDHIINTLFLLSSSLRSGTPLMLRRYMAKIYSYGGIHSGCGSAAVLWYLAFTILMTEHLVGDSDIDFAVAMLAYVMLFFLICILIFAHPLLRRKMHNCFEISHRFAGYTVIILFWTQIILTCRPSAKKTEGSFAMRLFTDVSFWCVAVVTLCLIYPWLRLQRKHVRAERLSSHAIRLHFDSRKPVDFCKGVRLSDRPLFETHAFAAIPHGPSPSDTGYSVLIADSGDWTSKIIREPPTHIYTKGAKIYGVLRVAVMFRPVLIVATGSGIGPCLSLLNGCSDLKCRVLWSTPSPLKSYGKALMDEVLRADPQALIVDTRRDGRPDLVRLAVKLVEEAAAEAAVVISNARVTKKMIYGLETRGIPAYGPIFDS